MPQVFIIVNGEERAGSAKEAEEHTASYSRGMHVAVKNTNLRALCLKIEGDDRQRTPKPRRLTCT